MSQKTPKQEGQLTHSRNCPERFRSDDDCTCGLQFRIYLQTEQTMGAAWRKRAEEAESSLAQARTQPAPVCPKCGSEKLYMRHIEPHIGYSAVQCPVCLPGGSFILKTPTDFAQFFTALPEVTNSYNVSYEFLHQLWQAVGGVPQGVNAIQQGCYEKCRDAYIAINRIFNQKINETTPAPEATKEDK